MSIHRAAAKVDKSQQPIVEAIEAEGWDCYLIRLPCDLLCWHPVLDIWQPLEVKTPQPNGKARARPSEQPNQKRFLRWTDLPVVTTPQQALEVLSQHYPIQAPVPQLIAYAHELRDHFEREWKQKGAASSARELVELRPHPQFVLVEDGP